MRWSNKQYQEGDQRIRKKFLWFPKTLKGQTRWLETARILQRREIAVDMIGGPCPEWVDTNWWDE